MDGSMQWFGTFDTYNTHTHCIENINTFTPLWNRKLQVKK